MRFPWTKELETRDDSFSDTLIAAIVGRAQGKTLALPSATAALEACAGTVGRGFASAEISGRPGVVDALSPDTLSLIGRSLVRAGEVVFLIDTVSGDLRLVPADTHDVMGGPFPETWRYNLTLGGPSRTLTYDSVPAASVLHFRYAVDASRPWKGHSPIEVASLAGKLSAETIRQLSDESSGPVGRLLGIPADGNDDSVAQLKEDIRDARGRVALLESGDWDAAGSGTTTLETYRFGAEPPAALVGLADFASREVIAAVGLHSGLWGGSGGASVVREAWRLALFAVLSPLGRLAETELRAKLDDNVKIGWEELRASDISGRARAFQSLVGGGMDVAKAVTVAGLVIED